MSVGGANVIIVDGSSGMGLATDQLARREGAQVVIVSRSSEKLQVCYDTFDEVSLTKYYFAPTLMVKNGSVTPIITAGEIFDHLKG